MSHTGDVRRSRDILRSWIEIGDRGLVKRSRRELLSRDLEGPGISGDPDRDLS